MARGLSELPALSCENIVPEPAFGGELDSQRPAPGRSGLRVAHLMAAIACPDHTTRKQLRSTRFPTLSGQGYTLGVSSAFSNNSIEDLPGHEQMENFAFAAPPGNPLVVADSLNATASHLPLICATNY